MTPDLSAALRTVLWEESPEGLCLVDSEFQILKANHSFLTLCRAETSRRVSSLSELCPSCEQTILDACAQVAKRNERVQLECHFQSPKGSPMEERLWQGRVSAVRAPKGSLKGYLIQVSDVTNARGDERRAQRALEGAHVAVWTRDLRSERSTLSPWWGRLLGYELGWKPGSSESWMEFVHSEERDRIAETWERFLTGAVPEFEQTYRIRAKGGSYRWVFSRATAREMDGETPIYVSGCLVDVTEHQQREISIKADLRKAAAALAESEAALLKESSMLSAILGGMREAVMAVDGEGTIVRLNPAAAWVRPIAESHPMEDWPRAFGTYRADGQTLYEVEDLPLVRAMRGEVVEEEEMFVKPPDSSEGRWLLINARPIEIEESATRLALIVFHDITRLKRVEADLRQAVDRVSRSNRELEHFGYVVSHDLREPLRMIYMYLELLNRRYGSSFSADAVDFINYAIDGAKRLNALIEALLEYSRLDRGTKSETIDAGVVLSEALASYTDEIAETEAVIEVGDLPSVRADSEQLKLVFEHLVGNALKFRRSERPRIAISCTADGELWRFSVSDNGIGIGADQVARIFNVFQRLHGREEYPGTGIGLALCRKVIENHGGRIWLESTPGRGTTFLFTLPR